MVSFDTILYMGSHNVFASEGTKAHKRGGDKIEGSDL